MTQFDDLARRAAAPPTRRRRRRCAPTTPSIRCGPPHSSDTTTHWCSTSPPPVPRRLLVVAPRGRASGAAAAAMVIVAGVGVVLSNGGEGDQDGHRGSRRDDGHDRPARSTVAPIPVEDGPAWNDIARAWRPTTSVAASPSRACRSTSRPRPRRSVSGTDCQRSVAAQDGEVTAETYVTTLRDRAGRTIMVGMKRGDEPPQLLRRAGRGGRRAAR